MSEMIERVARAICRAGMSGPKDHLNKQENLNWRKFEIEARAAIEAMREPTNAMVEASNREWDGRMSHRSSGAWQAMIDAALSPSPSPNSG